MIKTISQPDFSGRIISRYMTFLPAAQSPVELLPRRLPETGERQSPLLQSMRNIYHINQVTNENNILNINLSLRFLSGIISKTVRELSESTVRHIHMLAKTYIAGARPHRDAHMEPPAGTSAYPAVSVLLKRWEQAGPPTQIAMQNKPQTEYKSPQSAVLHGEPPQKNARDSIRSQPIKQEDMAVAASKTVAHIGREDAKSRLGLREASPPQTPAETRAKLLPALLEATESVPVWHRQLWGFPFDVPGNRDIALARYIQSGAFFPDYTRALLLNRHSEAPETNAFSSPPLQKRTPPVTDKQKPQPAEAGPVKQIELPNTAAQPQRRQTPLVTDMQNQQKKSKSKEPEPAKQVLFPQNSNAPQNMAQSPQNQKLRRMQPERAIKPYEAQAFQAQTRYPTEKQTLSEKEYHTHKPQAQQRLRDLTDSLQRSDINRMALRGDPAMPRQMQNIVTRLPAQSADIQNAWTRLPAHAADIQNALTRLPAQAADTQGSLIRLPAHAADMQSSLIRSPAQATDTQNILTRLPSQATDLQSSLIRSPAQSADTQNRQTKHSHPGVMQYATPASSGPIDSHRTKNDAANIGPHLYPNRAAPAGMRHAPKNIDIPSAAFVHESQARRLQAPNDTPAEPSLAEDIKFIKKNITRTVVNTQAVKTNTAVNMPGTTASPQGSVMNIDQQVNAIADKVYSALERRLRSERMRKGLL